MPPHPIAIFSSSVSWPLMSVCYPLCLALPSTFCHYTGWSPSSLPMTSLSNFPTGKKKKKKKKRKIREGRQCGMKRKSRQGTKDAVNYSETQAGGSEKWGEVYTGQQSPLSPQSPGLCTSSQGWLLVALETRPLSFMRLPGLVNNSENTSLLDDMGSAGIAPHTHLIQPPSPPLGQLLSRLSFINGTKNLNTPISGNSLRGWGKGCL